MKEYSVESAIEAARSAIHAMERIERDISRVNKHHLAPLGLETRLATETDPSSLYHQASAFNLNRQLWRNHLKQLNFLSRPQKRKLVAELGFDDSESDWQKNLFWERLDILDRIESDREKYIRAMEQSPSFDIQLKLSTEGGLTVEGDTKPHRETFKRHALSWYGPDLKWYVRGARGKPLTNELFVTAYELVKDLSSEGVTVSLAIEGKNVYPPESAEDETSIIDIKPQLIATPTLEEASQAPEPEAAPKLVAKPAEAAKVIHLAPMAPEATPEPDEPKKLLEHGQPIPISELKDYESPTEALRKLIRAKLKKACPEIRGAAMPNDHSYRVSFHAITLENLQISVGFNQVTVKQKRTILLSSKSADPAQLYADIENTLKAYIRENLKRIEISGSHFYARFDLDSFSVSDLDDRINQPRTIPSGNQKMALIRAYNWAAEKGKKLAGLSYGELIDMLTTATGVRCHSYCAMD